MENLIANDIYITEPTDEAVGFTAQAPSGDSFYNQNDLVIFDSTVSNIGGYYQTSSSQFLCPVDGMYAFSLNVLTGAASIFYGAIMKESAKLDSVWDDTTGENRDTASNLVIAVCSKGERVWIRSLTDSGVLHNNINAYTTFSGFLLNRL